LPESTELPASKVPTTPPTRRSQSFSCRRSSPFSHFTRSRLPEVLLR
jgi:hypothetical protein